MGDHDADVAMRVLIVSLNTYSAPYNDAKLECLGPHLDRLTAVSGDLPTLWGHDNPNRSGPGFEVVVLPTRFARSNATARLVGLQRVVDEVQPTLIHVECEPWQQVAVQSVKLAQRLGTRVGCQFAETGPLLHGAGGRFRRARGSWVLRRCDYAVGWSMGSTRVAERLAPGIRAETFPATGVSVAAAPDDASDPAESRERWFGPASAHLPKLAFVGRFAPNRLSGLQEKGVRAFLEICDALAPRLPLRAAIAGGAPDDPVVHRWAETRPWVSLHGILPRDEVASLLAAADVLVYPSHTTRVAEEQFGKAAVEAMAVGTPVFAYDCGALAEVIGRGGVVVPEGDQERLAEELKKHFTVGGTEPAVLAGAARRQARLFSDNVLAQRMLDLWST